MSRELIQTILDHRSVRQYKNQPMPPEDLEVFLQVVQSVPSSMHGQNCSVILVEDTSKRKQLAALSREQPYIETASLFFVIIMDFYRSYEASEALGEKQVIHQSAEGLLVGAVDAGIILESLIVTAEAMGYGTVAIGSVRNEPEKLIELLELPKYTFPIVGLCVGVPSEESHKKPRLPRESVILKDSYKKEVQRESVEKFDLLAKEYNKAYRGLDKGWSEGITEAYSTVYFPKVYGALKKQGFTMDR